MKGRQLKIKGSFKEGHTDSSLPQASKIKLGQEIPLARQ
jgi:hypothetical protein